MPRRRPRKPITQQRTPSTSIWPARNFRLRRQKWESRSRSIDRSRRSRRRSSRRRGIGQRNDYARRSRHWNLKLFAQLILNDHSRRGAELAPLVRESLHIAGIDFVEGGSPDDISAEADCIIAAGGDGTIIGAVAHALDRGLPLGVIPLGTFNELARTLAIPLDIAGAVRVIAYGHARCIDVGVVNGCYFVNEASIGISSRIARLQTPELKQRFGIFGVLYTALQAFRHSRAIHAEVEYEGKTERLKTIQMTVANSHRFGGFLNVAGAAIDDGWLDLYSVDIEHFREAFGIARAMFAGKRTDVPGLRSLRARRFEIRTHHPHHITADAEPAGTTPAVFELRPQALRVYAPQ